MFHNISASIPKKPPSNRLPRILAALLLALAALSPLRAADTNISGPMSINNGASMTYDTAVFSTGGNLTINNGNLTINNALNTVPAATDTHLNITSDIDGSRLTLGTSSASILSGTAISLNTSNGTAIQSAGTLILEAGTTIQNNLAAAPSEPGNYTATGINIATGATLEITKSTYSSTLSNTLIPGTNNSTLIGIRNNAGSLAFIDSTLNINNLGSNSDAIQPNEGSIGILNSGFMLLDNSTLTNDITGKMGDSGIKNTSTLTINRSTINTDAHGDSTAYINSLYNSGIITISNGTRYTNNISQAGGYGIRNSGAITIGSATIFETNLRLGIGFALEGSATLIIDSATYINNVIGDLGGSNGFSISGNSRLEIRNASTFTNNISAYSGISLGAGSTFSIADSAFTNLGNGGSAALGGGGATFTIDNSTFKNEVSAGLYGVQFWDSDIIIQNGTTFTNNVTNANGLFNGNNYTPTSRPHTLIQNSTFINNVTSGTGVMNYNNTTLTIENSTFRQDTRGGIGIDTSPSAIPDGTLNITGNSTFTSNTSGASTGIKNSLGIITLADNSTLTQNTADTSTGINNNSTLTLQDNATLTANTTGASTGIKNTGDITITGNSRTDLYGANALLSTSGNITIDSTANHALALHNGATATLTDTNLTITRDASHISLRVNQGATLLINGNSTVTTWGNGAMEPQSHAINSSGNITLDGNTTFLNRSGSFAGIDSQAGPSNITLTGNSTFTNEGGYGINAGGNTNITANGNATFVNNGSTGINPQAYGSILFTENSTFINNARAGIEQSIGEGNFTITFTQNAEFHNDSTTGGTGITGKNGSHIEFSAYSRLYNNSTAGGINLGENNSSALITGNTTITVNAGIGLNNNSRNFTLSGNATIEANAGTGLYNGNTTTLNDNVRFTADNNANAISNIQNLTINGTSTAITVTTTGTTATGIQNTGNITITDNARLDLYSTNALRSTAGDITIDSTADNALHLHSSATATLDNTALNINHTAGTSSLNIESSATLDIRSASTLALNNTGTGNSINNTGTLTIQNGATLDNTLSSGNGIHNTGSIAITNASLSQDSSTPGSIAIYNLGGRILAENSTLNLLNSGGYGIYSDNGGTFTTTNSTLTANVTAGHGILNTNGSTLSLANSTLNLESSGSYGLYNYNNSLATLGNSTLLTASITAGHGILNGAGATLSIDDSAIELDVSNAADGIRNESGAQILLSNNATLTANVATSTATGIVNNIDSLLSLAENSTLTSNAADGTGINNSGTITIDGTSTINNTGANALINTGTIVVDGTTTGSPLKHNAGTIAGTGNIASIDIGSNSARLSPGSYDTANSTSSIGTLTINNAQTWAGFTYDWQLDLSNNTSDLLSLDSTLTLTGNSPSSYTLNLLFLNPLNPSSLEGIDTWQLLSASSILGFSDTAWTLQNTDLFLAAIERTGLGTLSVEHRSNLLYLVFTPSNPDLGNFIWNTGTPSGIWNDNTNWESFPNLPAAGDTAQFIRNQTGTSTITITGATVGSLIIGSENASAATYILDGGTIHFDNLGNTSLITHHKNATAGDTITSNLALGTSTLQIDARSANTLTLNGIISADGVANSGTATTLNIISSTGSGQLTLNTNGIGRIMLQTLAITGNVTVNHNNHYAGPNVYERAGIFLANGQFNITADARFNNTNTAGNGIYSFSTLNLNNATFDNNVSGGIGYTQHGSLINITNKAHFINTVSAGTGLQLTIATLNIDDSLFDNNVSGGTAFSSYYGPINILNGSIFNNNVSASTGIAAGYDGTQSNGLTIDASTFNNNITGGIGIYSHPTPVRIQNASTFNNNVSAGTGLHLYANDLVGVDQKGGNLIVTNSTFNQDITGGTGINVIYQVGVDFSDSTYNSTVTATTQNATGLNNGFRITGNFATRFNTNTTLVGNITANATTPAAVTAIGIQNDGNLSFASSTYTASIASHNARSTATAIQNDFNGNITISDTALNLATNGTLATAILNNGSISMKASTLSIDATGNSTAIRNAGTLTLSTASSIAGSIASSTGILNTGTLTLEDSSYIDFFGTINNGNAIINSNGRIILNGTSTLYLGDSGTGNALLNIRNTAGNAILINSGATLNLANSKVSQSITAGNGIANYGTLTLDGTTLYNTGTIYGNAIYNAAILNLANNTQLTLTGTTFYNAGILGIDGTSSLILAERGQLIIDGALSGKAITLVDGNQLIGGNGTISSTLNAINSSVRLSPGSYDSSTDTSKIGTLTLSGDQVWSGFTYDWQFAKVLEDHPGDNADLIQIVGSLTLSGAAENYLLNVSPIAPVENAYALGDPNNTVVTTLIATNSAINFTNGLSLAALNIGMRPSFKDILRANGYRGILELLLTNSGQNLSIAFTATPRHYWETDTPSGIWHDDDNWENLFPEYTGEAAYFTRNQSVTAYINLDDNVTIGDLHIGAENATATDTQYVISGIGAITLNATNSTLDTEPPSYLVHSANAQNIDIINVDFSLENDLDIVTHATKSGVELQLNGNITLHSGTSTANITKNGTGTLTATGSINTGTTGAFRVNKGRFNLDGALTTQRLTIAAGAILSGNGILTGDILFEDSAIFTQDKPGARYRDRMRVTGDGALSNYNTFNLSMNLTSDTGIGANGKGLSRYITTQTSGIDFTGTLTLATTTYTLNLYNIGDFNITDWSYAPSTDGIYYQLITASNIANFDNATWAINWLTTPPDDLAAWSIMKTELNGIHTIWLYYSNPARIPEPATTAALLSLLILPAILLIRKQRRQK